LLLISETLPGAFLAGWVSDAAGFRAIAMLFLRASRMSTTGFVAAAGSRTGAVLACPAFFAIMASRIALVPFDRIKEWKLVDAYQGIDSAREIREYFIPDFSNWKNHDSYAKAFDRLLGDLKAGAHGQATT
jgi:hypothetical protein